jgi:hypothetical protein
VQALAFSGGKDSTALALRMAETGEEFVNLFNVVGNELPDLLGHVAKVTALTGKRLECTNPGKSLISLIRGYESLPNQNMRWCTRQLKIEPTKAWLLSHPGAVLCVGLRADEPERGAATLYGESVTYRTPLREWGWGLEEVWAYLDRRGVTVPDRTDCALCYDQRLSEWWRLWKEHPDMWALGEELEELTGHTFRSDTRDTWPASMRGLRERFEAGDAPRDIKPLPLFGEYDVKARNRCRVCSL